MCIIKIYQKHRTGWAVRHGTVTVGGGSVTALNLAELVPNATILGWRVTLRSVTASRLFTLHCTTLYLPYYRRQGVVIVSLRVSLKFNPIKFINAPVLVPPVDWCGGRGRPG